MWQCKWNLQPIQVYSVHLYKWCHLVAKFVTHLAINEMIQVRDSIAWVCCASGNVSWVGSYFYGPFCFWCFWQWRTPCCLRSRHSGASAQLSMERRNLKYNFVSHFHLKSSLNWLLGLAPSSLGLQELASQVGSINYPLALMVSPA